MPPGRRRAHSPATQKRIDARRRVQTEKLKPSSLEAVVHGDTLYRGIMDELVRPAGRAPLTVWMLAWRCKRCGYTWPVRRFRHTTGPHAGDVFTPKPGGTTPTLTPKKCPGCDTKDWWREYREPLNGNIRKGRTRKPYMIADYVAAVVAPAETEPEEAK